MLSEGKHHLIKRDMVQDDGGVRDEIKAATSLVVSSIAKENAEWSEVRVYG